MHRPQPSSPSYISSIFASFAMEVAASAIGIVSLSLQLIETIKKIKNFIRDVKNASKELSRLEDLLERLGALIQDIRAVMEKQKSLPSQHVPAPSTSVFFSLKACEKSLEPLLEIVNKFQDSRVHGNSTMARLKSDIRFGLKTKVILEFETRVQHEMNYLQIALLTNVTNIVTGTTVIYQQQAVITSQPCPSNQTISQQGTLTMKNTEDIVDLQSSNLKFSQTTFLTRSSLDKFGVHKQSLICYMHPQDDTKVIVSEEHQYFWNWRLMGYGFRWKQYRETIIPSLSVYPVVSGFGDLVLSTMRNGDILEFQQMLSSGSLHPFTRDLGGHSLLHFAAIYARDDLCRLLYAHGLRPDMAPSTRLTPLLGAFISVHSHDGTTSQRSAMINTLRGLIKVSCDSADFETNRLRDIELSTADTCQITDWFWDHVTSNFSGSELLRFHSMIFRKLVTLMSRDMLWDNTYTTLRTLAPKMTKSNLLLDEILMGNMYALVFLWDRLPDDENESQESGSRYIALLKSLGVDFKRSIEAELGKFPGRILPSHRGMNILDQKILFYQNEEQDWILRWEWVLDEEAPGSLLLLEFPKMTFDVCNLWSYDDWPFFTPSPKPPLDDYYQRGPKWDARRARRLAKTARKELARTGQKRPRSRMPGAWI